MSLYDLLLKATFGRLPPEAMLLPEAVRASGLEELCLTAPRLVPAARLDWEHGDPTGAASYWISRLWKKWI